MAVKQPVNIDGIEFDCLLEEDYALEAESPDYVVESGYTIGDSIILKAETLSLKLFVSDRPVTFIDRFGTGGNRVERVVKALKDLYYAKKLVSVTLPDAQYDNMAVQSLTISRTNEFGYAREIPITLKHIRITQTQTTTIPEEYGKSGNTKASAGTASTSSGKASKARSGSGDPTDAALASAVSSAASALNNAQSGSRGSILYKLSSNIGLI